MTLPILEYVWKNSDSPLNYYSLPTPDHYYELYISEGRLLKRNCLHKANQKVSFINKELTTNTHKRNSRNTMQGSK